VAIKNRFEVPPNRSLYGVCPDYRLPLLLLHEQKAGHTLGIDGEATSPANILKNTSPRRLPNSAFGLIAEYAFKENSR
jgi:hypothetical protein